MNQSLYWDQLAYAKYDLTNCESEPLKFCGAVQSFGVFLGCDQSSKTIVAASVNCKEILGTNAQELLGALAADVLRFGDGSVFDFERALSAARSGPVFVKTKLDARIFSVVPSTSDGIWCLDFEPYDASLEGAPGRAGVYDPVQDLKHLVHLLDESKDIESITQKAADQIRMITGFDRVMIYKFEANWDGQVISESRREDLAPYLHLFYPASDIPAQARRLYLDSKFRMIVDTQELPCPILTSAGFNKNSIDLGASVLRASSPIHIQYLQNMGVRTSFSVPIKLNGQLWGLVSCHGYGNPLRLTRQTRTACELAAQVLSGRIADAVSERRLKIKNEVFELTQSLLATVTEGESAIRAFGLISEKLLKLTDSTGAFVRVAGEQLTIGATPPAHWLEQIVENLAGKQSLALWETRSLHTDMKIPFDRKTTGALAVPFSLGFDDLLIWFRPEFEHEVQWGGKPSEHDHAVKTLEPRASFAAWTQNVKEQCRAWSEADRETAQSLLFTFVQGIFKKAADLSRANSALERATKTKDEFIGMVSHELRTPLGVMIGWIDVLREYQFRDPEVNQAIEVLERNAKLQINLINDLLDVSRITSGKMRINLESGVDVCPIAHDAVKALRPTAQAKGIELHCEDCGSISAIVDSERLRQILWNLITNAIKFTPRGGKVTVWIESSTEAITFGVKDNGIGIAEKEIGRIFNRFEQIDANGARTGGLGLGLSIVRSLVELHGGSISVASDGPGLGSTFTVVLPIFVLAKQLPVEPVAIPLKPRMSLELEGIRIMLAEDHVDSAMAMALTLRRQGAIVTVAADGKEAFNHLQRERFDLILSDIGMPEMDGYELMKLWRSVEEQKSLPVTPAIALTAYATSQDRTKALQAGFQSHIPKPLDKGELMAVIKLLNIQKGSAN